MLSYIGPFRHCCNAAFDLDDYSYFYMSWHDHATVLVPQTLNKLEMRAAREYNLYDGDLFLIEIFHEDISVVIVQMASHPHSETCLALPLTMKLFSILHAIS